MNPLEEFTARDAANNDLPNLGRSKSESDYSFGEPSEKLSLLTGVWRQRDGRHSLGGGPFCDMLSSLFSLGLSRRFEVVVGLVGY